jgi:hypothetical protein
VEPAFRLDVSPEPASGIRCKAPVREIEAPALAARTHALEISVSLLLVLATLAVTGAWFAKLAPSASSPRSNVHLPH